MDKAEFEKMECGVTFEYDPVLKNNSKHKINRSEYSNFNDAV